MPIKDTYCSFCGIQFPYYQTYPRSCGSCGQITYSNPMTVSVVLAPYGQGLIGVRRGRNPGYGLVALPGGFIEQGETWQQGGARELFEETGIVVDPAELVLAHMPGFEAIHTATNGNLLIFMTTRKHVEEPEGGFQTDEETLEVAPIVDADPLAFSLHTEAVEAYFSL